MKTHYRIEDASAEATEYAGLLDALLDSHAASAGLPFDCPKYAIVAVDTDRRFMGGLRGFFVQGRFALEELAVLGPARHKGVGSALLRRIETDAKARGAKSVYLGTWEFQAPAFYEKHGYHRLFGLSEVEGFPSKIWMEKFI